MPNLIATKWVDQNTGHWIEAVGSRSGGALLFAVRRDDGCCLNKQGGWEFEPSPSNRSDGFRDRCRWSDFGAASKALDGADNDS